ncbi:Uncharacterised protein [BD1-7 clade bacterium]|uniref:EamA domain-containing protein n=1 Tax=BD1-7 clade bacterium TaxID=2029982 RepID=A0A5S9QZH5_9GAMM|nr:Uncharacterised protein [BD1-7 clade bacterium]
MSTITIVRPAGLAQWQADVLLLIVTLAAAAGWIFSKNTLTELPPVGFIGIRFFLAGLCLGLFCYKEVLALPARALGAGLITGLVFGLAMMTWIQGLALSVHVGVSAFVVSLGVMFVPFFAWLIFKEPLAKSVILALPIAIAGLALLNLGSPQTEGWQWDGAHLVMLAAASIFAFQFCLTAFLAKRIAPLPLTAMQLTVAGSVALLVSMATESLDVSVTAFGWSNLLAAALIASSLRFFLQTKALEFSSASHAGMILLLEPVWVTLLGWMVFAQTLTFYQMIGCCLIFSALVLQKVCQLKSV